jgi:hypothetical protein
MSAPGHAIPFHILPAHQLTGRSAKQEPDEDPDRSHDKRIEHPGTRCQRDNVALVHRGDGDHGEVEHVSEGHVPIVVVLTETCGG